MINRYFILHVICAILVISIAFLPIKFIKQSGIFIIPCCLTILWLFTTCPLNKYHTTDSTKEYHFIKECFDLCSIDISIKQCHKIATFIVSVVPSIIVYRCLYLSDK